jgi:YD repeat-containing protein
MTKLQEPDGAVLIFESQNDGLRNKKYDALGYATQYSYLNGKTIADTASDNFGNVSREQDAFNYTTDTSYGPYDQVAAVKDKRNITTSTTYYTAAGTCSKIGKPQSVTLSKLTQAGQALTNVTLRDYCWNSNGTLNTLTEYIDPTDATRKRVTQYTYETISNGLNVSDVNIKGSGKTIHTHFTYDALGRKQSETLYRQTSPTVPALVAQTTRYTYDDLDRLVTTTDPDGNIHETVFDANGQVYQEKMSYPTTVTRPNCAAPTGGYVVCTEATHQYDAADRRISSKDVLGANTSFAYDEAGNVIKTTDANGHVTRYEYDAMNRKTAVIDGNGQRTETQYDLAGHPIAVTNANGETVKNTYDKTGHLTQTTDPLGNSTQYKYDANGNLYGYVTVNC